MNNKDFILNFIASLVFGFILVWIVNFYIDKVNSNRMRMIRYQTPQETREQIQFLRDSFQMEYYKKQLESYPYEHSKIITNDATK